MTFNSVLALYFSPKGSTAKLCRAVASELAIALNIDFTEYDFTLPAMRLAPPSIAKNTLVVVASPVYAGRIPNLMLPYAQGFFGEDCAAVPIAVYGGRSFDQALTEWKSLLIKNGFFVPAAAAFVAQHAFAPALSQNRPDASDLATAKSFAKDLATLSLSLTGGENVTLPFDGEELIYYKPTDSLGNAVNFLKAKPKVASSCDNCGLCAALCPMGAIDLHQPTVYLAPCIKCNACISACPKHARYFDDAGFIAHREHLENNFKDIKKPSVFMWKARS